MGLKALTNYLRQLSLIIIVIVTLLLHFCQEHSLPSSQWNYKRNFFEYWFDIVPVTVTTQKKERKKLLLFLKLFSHSNCTMNCVARANRTEKSIQSNINVVNKQINEPEKEKHVRSADCRPIANSERPRNKPMLTRPEMETSICHSVGYIYRSSSVFAGPIPAMARWQAGIKTRRMRTAWKGETRKIMCVRVICERRWDK